MSTHELNFTSKVHARLSPSTDPSSVSLPSGFTVVILGASRGIGAAAARSYAIARATTLVLVARDTSSLKATATACHNFRPQLNILLEACDVSSASSVAALAESIKAKTNRLDVIIVNAGYSGPVVLDVTEGEPEDFKRCLDINTLGTYYAAHYLLPPLLASSDGAKAFLVVSSAAAWITQGSIANIGYCVGKLAQTRVVEMVGKQFERQGLLAIAVHPGAVRTEMAEGAPEEFKKYLSDSVDLCGGVSVWLTKDVEKRSFLNGRYVAATWDMDEVRERMEEIVTKDLLRGRIAMN